jgi:peptidyl-prolyl cis-trans isomerase SurA
MFLKKPLQEEIMKFLTTSKITCTVFVLALIFNTLQTAFCQEKNIDKIVARVDNYIVLRSEVEVLYYQMLSAGQLPPENPKCEILKTLVLNKMLSAKAEADSIIVEPKMVNAELDRRMQVFITQAGDQEKLEKAIGKSIIQLKEELRDQVQEQMVIREVQEHITRDVKITPAQVKRFFNRIPSDSIPFLPAEVEVGQIVFYPKVSHEEKEKIRLQLLTFKQKILNGEEDFAELAKKYSEDPSSGARGGDLGWQGRGDLVPQFEATALKIDVNQIADPVESDFGFHLIQLLERRGNRFRARHILIRPHPNTEDIARAIILADSVRGLILADSMDFTKAAKTFSDDLPTRSNGGFFKDNQTGSSKISLDELESSIFFTIDTMKIGTYSKPMKYRTEDGKDAVRFLYYKSYQPPHYANLKDDYQKIANVAIEEQKRLALDAWVKKAQTDVYVYIDEDYRTCRIVEERQ